MGDTTRLFDRLDRTNVRVAEAVLDLYAQLGLTDPRDIYGDLDGMQPFPPGLPPIFKDTQGRGEVLPVYLTWLQLKYIRDRSRRLCAENEFAQCALQNRVNYCVGKGFIYKAVSEDEAIAEAAQDQIDQFIEKNEWPEREAEYLWRCDRDGEAFLRFFDQSDGILAVRFVEPECIKDPTGDAGDPREAFGVETTFLDLENVLNYWVIENPYQNQQPVRVSGKKILHTKFNVDMNAKRGLPSLYPIEGNLRRAEELINAITAMAKARGKIALIRHMQGVSRDASQNLINQVQVGTVTDPSAGTVRTIERMPFGTVLTSSDKVQYEFPDGKTDAAGYVEILQANLRGCAARLNMPEWMLTAMTGDANYATALVSEAPSTKSFERVQRMLARAFGESKRPGPKMAAMWRQLEYAVWCGNLPREALEQVTIRVECPSVTARDKMQEAQVNEIYHNMGAKSIETIQMEAGLDPEQENDKLAKEKEQQAAEQPPIDPNAPPGSEIGDTGNPPVDQGNGNPVEKDPAPEGSPGSSPRAGVPE